jgi:hypothetical protein
LIEGVLRSHILTRQSRYMLIEVFNKELVTHLSSSTQFCYTHHISTLLMNIIKFNTFYNITEIANLKLNVTGRRRSTLYLNRNVEQYSVASQLLDYFNYL